MKDKTFKLCFAAFAVLTAAIPLSKAGRNSTHKEAFAARKPWSE